MPKLDQVTLRCLNPEAQSQFYCEALDMQVHSDGSVGYGGEQAALAFQKGESEYKPKSNDLYWKIALSVPNIELACHQLTEKGIQVAAPEQFKDVAYLAHFSDPEGFTIELIDHWFKDNRQNQVINDHVFGGGAHFNLLTLRTTQIDKITQSCLQCGMKLLSIQPVESHGFTLYFFAFTSDFPPSKDPYAVENREWLYQRKYTVLEIQQVHRQINICTANLSEAGYIGTL